MPKFELPKDLSLPKELPEGFELPKLPKFRREDAERARTARPMRLRYR